MITIPSSCRYVITILLNKHLVILYISWLYFNDYLTSNYKRNELKIILSL